MSEELKPDPCPFCEVQLAHRVGEPGWVHLDGNCFMACMVVFTHEVGKWNRRALPEQVKALTEYVQHREECFWGGIVQTDGDELKFDDRCNCGLKEALSPFPLDTDRTKEGI